MQGHEMVPEQSVSGECDERGLRENGPGKDRVFEFIIFVLLGYFV